MSKPGKNKTGKPRKVPEDIREKQDPEYSQRDFERDLEKVTKRLENPSEPGRGKPKT
jgi:hypothetical protein